CCAQTLGGATAVGADQSAGAEPDATEPAGDAHRHTVQALAIDGGEDRLAGGTAHFAIVVETIVTTDAIGPGVVVRVGDAVRTQDLECLLDVAHRHRPRVEAAAVDIKAVLDRTGEGCAHVCG